MCVVVQCDHFYSVLRWDITLNHTVILDPALPLNLDPLLFPNDLKLCDNNHKKNWFLSDHFNHNTAQTGSKTSA